MEENTKSGIQLPDVPLNPWRIAPPEGELMIVKKGNQNGPLDMIVASVAGWHFRYQEKKEVDQDHTLWDEDAVEKWDLLPDIDEVTKVRSYTPPRNRGMLRTEFGIIPVGPGRALYRPHTHYVKWEVKENETTASLVEKDRKDSPFFFWQYLMAISMQKVESVGNFQSTIKTNLLVRIINPYKAMHQTGGWESFLDGAVQAIVKDYISPLTVAEIRVEKESRGLAKRIMTLNGVVDANGGVDDFMKKSGVQIIDARFLGFDTIGSPKVQDALEDEEVSKLKAAAAIPKAEEIMTLGKANADAAALLVAAYSQPGGEAAAMVRAAEVLGASIKGAQVISLGGGNLPIAISAPPKK